MVVLDAQFCQVYTQGSLIKYVLFDLHTVPFAIGGEHCRTLTLRVCLHARARFYTASP